ncbi:MAG: cytidylate kinase-like family protein [Candidatus Omnitrophica bacterium]|nr:cytidylate kinase-like family protein [Candidatus Omnitrophota bacterium]
MDEFNKFLESQLYPRREKKEVPRPFVTVSRQTGAGGHTFANMLVGRMAAEEDPLFWGWRIFDRELCTRVLEDPKIKISLESLLTEEYRSQVEDMLFNLLEDQTPQEIVIKKIFETLITLASFGNVILIGRGGACVTSRLPGGIHLRLVAPETTRVRRMQDLLGIGQQQAKKIVAEQDAARRQLVKECFGKDIDDPLLYDAVWNTEKIPMPVIVEMTMEMIKRKAAELKEKFSVSGCRCEDR